MKPLAVIESLRFTYDTAYMKNQFDAMLKGAYPNATEEQKQDLSRFLFEAFSISKVLEWQPHKNWTIPEVKEFLDLYIQYFNTNPLTHYKMVDDFFVQLATYTAEMLKEPLKKDDFPFWFLTMYLRPAMNS